jgi:hypothetical protein
MADLTEEDPQWDFLKSEERAIARHVIANRQSIAYRLGVPVDRVRCGYKLLRGPVALVLGSFMVWFTSSGTCTNLFGQPVATVCITDVQGLEPSDDERVDVERLIGDAFPAFSLTRVERVEPVQRYAYKRDAPLTCHRLTLRGAAREADFPSLFVLCRRALAANRVDPHAIAPYLGLDVVLKLCELRWKDSPMAS